VLFRSVIRHEDFRPGGFDAYDLAVVGPGPGDPRDDDDPKIATFRQAVDRLLDRGQPFLAVCLGHQVLCDRLAIPLVYKDIVFQGTQDEVTVEGQKERVGFYNTFVGRVGDGSPLRPDIAVDADPATGDVHVVRGPHFRGIQFHAESILTQRGSEVIHRLAADLLSEPGHRQNA